MAFATVDELADALGIKASSANQQVLEDCLDAAYVEIVHALGSAVYLDPPSGLLVRTNVNRAVEWYKAPAAANGGVGYVGIGTMQAPTSGFERHALVLLPYKVEWGLA
jgi:hypothetical protein